MNSLREYTFADEAKAHATRRDMIRAGKSVSLIAYDGMRDVYVFDGSANSEVR